MVLSSCSYEMTLNASLDRVWRAALRDAHNLFPKIMPDRVAKAELVGDGEVGSVKVYHFAPAASRMAQASLIKDYVEVLDHEKHESRYRVIEGGLIGKKLKSHIFQSKFEELGEDSCLAKVTIEFDSLDEEKPLGEEDVRIIKNGAMSVLKAVEAYLLANPHAYLSDDLPQH